VLDILVMLSDIRLDSVDAFFHLNGGQIVAEAKIHGEQNRVWTEVHGQRSLDLFDA